jgi:hypothetical protein
MNHNFNYFLNKFCTVIVPAINRKYSEDQNNAYFLGKVLSINGDGVLIEHPSTKCKTFFNMNNIIAIAEEVVMLGDKQNNSTDLKTT